ncbi:hypothetical protein [Peterkaempfera bronchialis]|uniref:hypothetical protein n=1 Tax=Peterkaempfera bronchialis TaxID=2126346 RepID=UPI001E65AB50|nr:hypothetical protein [Peterkaempfera bronchialis]
MGWGRGWEGAAGDRRAEGTGRASAVAPGTWVRGVGYHESVAGPLDRDRLDALVAHRPVRVQHRSGALWILNSAGAALLGLDDPDRVAVARWRTTRRRGVGADADRKPPWPVCSTAPAGADLGPGVR